MRSSSQEAPERRECPKHVTRALRLAGGVNRFGEPNFRVVWGYNRIVPMTGEWQEFEHMQATLWDKKTGYAETRQFVQLKKSVVETRMVPKYLPGNCWHLEKWRPPEEYGSPENWRKVGEEVLQGMTIDTAGEFPSRGEYELCYPLTSDCTSHGTPIILVADVVADIANMIRRDKEQLTFQQRRAAIEQREAHREEGFFKRTCDILRDGLKPFAGETFVTVPKSQPSHKEA